MLVRLRNTLRKVDGFAAWISGAAIFVIILHICADVISNYVFNALILGTKIIVNYYIPDAVQRHLLTWIKMYVAIIFLLLAWTAGQVMITKWERESFLIGQGVKIATSAGYICPPIGYGLISLLFFSQFFKPPVWSTFPIERGTSLGTGTSGE